MKLDRKKNEWQLASEVNELKKQRNKDMNDIKLLKVELLKLEKLFKKYKEIVPVGSMTFTQITLPNFA